MCVQALFLVVDKQEACIHLSSCGLGHYLLNLDTCKSQCPNTSILLNPTLRIVLASAHHSGKSTQKLKIYQCLT